MIYGSIRTEASAGEAYFHSGTKKVFVCYFKKANAFTAGSLYVPMPIGEPVLLTSTQGLEKLYVAINYYIETVEAV